MTSFLRTKTELAGLSLVAGLLACDPAGAGDAPPGGPQGRGPGPSPAGGVDVPTEDLVPRVRMLAQRFDARPTPPAPEVEDAMWTLGQALAFDKILSGNGDVSCMTCHHPSVGTDDDRALPLGVGGEGLGAARTGGALIPRNAPALFNLHAYRTMFWDSRVQRQDGVIVTPAAGHIDGEMLSVLEGSELGLVSAQALFPVTSREEMRGYVGENDLAELADDDFSGIWAGLMLRLGETAEYPGLFEAAYPGANFEEMTFAHAANAIASFEVATFESRQSPWERFLEGDDAAMSEPQLRGAVDFFERGCASCHRGVGLSDFRSHNIGMPQLGPGKGHGVDGDDDFGRGGVTDEGRDRYAFRTPVLTNTELTAPYGHAGQFASLRRHIEHYADPRASLGGYAIEDEVDDPGLWGMFVDNIEAVLADLSPRLRGVRLRTDDEEAVDALLDFMEALTDADVTEMAGVVPDSVPSGLPVAD